MSITAKTIQAVGITASSIIAKTVQVYSDIVCRYVSNFNGTSSYVESLNRIIDLDAVDPSFTITMDFDPKVGRGIFGQSISKTDSEKEFAYTFFSDDLRLILGGNIYAFTTGYMEAGYGVYVFTYNHATSTALIFKDGVQLYSKTGVTIGAAREPTARAFYMASSNGSVGNYRFRNSGYLKNVLIEHNGVTVDLPMTEHNKDIDDEILYINDASDVDDFKLDLLGTASSGLNINNQQLTGDFSISVWVKLNGAAGTIMTFSDGTSVYYQSSSNVSFRVRDLSDTYVYGGGIGYTAGQSAKVTFTRVGSTFSVYVNESTQTPRTITAKASYTLTSFGLNNPFVSNGIYWNAITLDSASQTVLDMPINEYKSNFVSNLANPLGSNVWDDNSAVLTGDTTELNGQYSMTTATSSVYLDVPSSTGLGYLLTIDLVSGDIQELEGGLSSVQNTGWQNARDAQQQPITNRYVTLVNNTTNDNLTITKTGSSPVVFNSVSYQRAIDYGVLNGTRGTDYDWASDGHHAIGYDITTEHVCE